jgi:hypothetical protein
MHGVFYNLAGDQWVMFVQSRLRTTSAIAAIDFRDVAVYG